jgi:hypothetical protein
VTVPVVAPRMICAFVNVTVPVVVMSDSASVSVAV